MEKGTTTQRQAALQSNRTAGVARWPLYPAVHVLQWFQRQVCVSSSSHITEALQVCATVVVLVPSMWQNPVQRSDNCLSVWTPPGLREFVVARAELYPASGVRTLQQPSSNCVSCATDLVIVQAWTGAGAMFGEMGFARQSQRQQKKSSYYSAAGSKCRAYGLKRPQRSSDVVLISMCVQEVEPILTLMRTESKQHHALSHIRSAFAIPAKAYIVPCSPCCTPDGQASRDGLVVTTATLCSIGRVASAAR